MSTRSPDERVSTPRQNRRKVRKRPSGWIAFGVSLAIAALIFGGGKLLFDVAEDQIADELRGNAVLEKHLGTIRDVKMAWRDDSILENGLVADVYGTKGHAKVHFTKAQDLKRVEITQAIVLRKNGTIIDLLPAKTPSRNTETEGSRK